VAGLVGHLVFQLAPAVREVGETPSARDYASYHYAVQAAADGLDPYDVGDLGRLSRAEKTRRTVQPYFYPPPFLLTQLWSLPLTLTQGYWGSLLLNEALLAGCLAVAVRAFGVGMPAVALLLTTFSPIPDNAWMGQANLIALFPALLGLALARTRPWAGGVLVGAAAMFKMSPALFLLWWALRREWRPVAAAVGTAVGLSLLTLPLVDLPTQVRFYTEVLPGFGRGDYHGLTVPISLPANHSVPDLFARLWPGPTPTSMSDRALLASRLVSLALLAGWAWRFWRPPPGADAAAEAACALGALTVLMVVLPAYTYEHHLVFLLLPVGLLLGLRPLWLVVPAWFFLAWPLDWLRWTQRFTGLDELLRESKFIAEALVFGLLLWGRSAPAASGARGAVPEAHPTVRPEAEAGHDGG